MKSNANLYRREDITDYIFSDIGAREYSKRSKLRTPYWFGALKYKVTSDLCFSDLML